MRLTSLTVRRAATLLTLVVASNGFLPLEAVAAATSAKTQTVAIKGFAFTPKVITITPGTTLTWTNQDDDPHTVTANDRRFHSAALDSNNKFSFTFTKPGTYAYFCSLHPHMTGKVIVRAR